MNARLPLFAALLGAATFTTQAQSLNTAKLDSLLTSLAANNKLMGSLALSHEGTVVYSHAFGAARLDPTVPATEATRYRIGSISKVFTATMIFQLIEEKKLTLDTKLATFFPQLPNAQAITIDQLLSHRSGLHSLTSDPAYEQYMTQPKTQAELLAIIAATKPDFEPGAKYAYSNSGYIVLGYIVEKLTRQTYAKAVQQRIARKVGLRSTSYGGKIDPGQQQALSYQRTAAGWQLSPETDMSIPGGAGALVATPADLNRFLTALFGGRLVSAGSLVAMRTIRDGYGRGLMEQSFGGTVPGYGHSGGIDEFASRAFYFPDQQLAISLCTNGGTFSLSEVVAAALKIYRNQPYRLPDLQATAYVPAPADLDRYAGTYASPSLPLKISFKKEGNTLLSQATGQSPFALEPVSRGVFKFDPAGIRAEFAADKPMFTLKQGGREFVFTKE